VIAAQLSHFLDDGVNENNGIHKAFFGKPGWLYRRREKPDVFETGLLAAGVRCQWRKSLRLVIEIILLVHSNLCAGGGVTRGGV